MARVTDQNQSSLSGKAYGQVYVHLNGQTFTRSLPRYKKDSATRGMLQNQKRFKKVNEFCALFKDSLIPQIWKGVSPKMSGYALFLKSNMAAFAPDGSLEDAQKIQLSIGNLSFPPGFEARRMEVDETLIEVSWPRQLNVGGIHTKDELMAISAGEGEYSEITETGLTREMLGGSFELPLLNTVANHLYLFFRSRDRRDYSESRCMEI